MKQNFRLILAILFCPLLSLAQVDATAKKAGDSATKMMADTAMKVVHDTIVPVKKPDTTVIATPSNCYKEWYDFFRTRGSKPVTDGTHEVVIAFKSGESCHCFMGKIDVVGGKIKKPLYVRSESGEYKTFESLGKKLDQEFIANEGADLWNITDGMSVMFITADKEYGRIFFYKFLNKSAQSNKEAPSPTDLIKD